MRTKEAATQFLAAKRIAVTGVSRVGRGHGSNAVYQRLRASGYDVFPVNPVAETVEGDRAYPSLSAIPGGVDAVVIATSPTRAETTMRECIDVGVHHVWMHRSVGAGSLSSAATRLGRRHGVVVIDGGCPLMFDPTSDGLHRALCPLLKLFGTVPRVVA